MMYWLNGAGASSARLYWESFGGAAGNSIPVTSPWARRFSPKRFFAQPAFRKRGYKNIVFWRDKDNGGHFAAFEQPDVFVSEIRTALS